MTIDQKTSNNASRPTASRADRFGWVARLRQLPPPYRLTRQVSDTRPLP